MERQLLFTPRVLWAALMVSVVLYGFVLTQLPPPEEAVAPPLPPLVLWPLTLILTLASVVLVPMSMHGDSEW